MKKIWGKLTVALSVLILCLALPVMVSASEQTLADVVELDVLDRHLQNEYEKRFAYSGTMTIDLTEFHIPVSMAGELGSRMQKLLPDMYLSTDRRLVYSGTELVRLEYTQMASREEIRSVARVLLRNLEGNTNLTDMEKALIVHDRMNAWTDRTPAGIFLHDYHYDISGALIQRGAEPLGYAKAYQYLLARVGIYSQVYGSSYNDTGWVAVLIDGTYYAVDAYHDDTSGSHAYFMCDNIKYGVDGITYGTDYNGTNWPYQAFCLDGRAYGVFDGRLYRMVNLLPQGDPVCTDTKLQETRMLEVGDKLLVQDGDCLYRLDMDSNILQRVLRVSHLGKPEYQGDRVVCYVDAVPQNLFVNLTYPVTFKDWDGKVLQTGTYEFCQMVYAPKAPRRSGYVFTGWDKAISPCTQEMVYTAQYTRAKQADGWVKENGQWYYITGGQKYTGWLQSGGKWYYLGYTGVMKTGMVNLPQTTDYSTWTNAFYYLDANGVMQTGWHKMEGNWYYFKSSGVAAVGWSKIDGKWYFFSETGIMKTGWHYEGGKTYLLSDSGDMVTGWYKINGMWYYFKPDGARAEGWSQVGGKWYYFHESGHFMVVGWHRIGETRYFFRSDGTMATGWQDTGDYWYCFDNNGLITTGWKQKNGKWYYFSENDADRGQMMQDKVGYINGKHYFFDREGAMVTGWYKDGDKWFYCNASGVQVNGWQKIDGKWYYFKKDGGGWRDYMVTGLTTIGGKKYYFSSSGVMGTGWIRVPRVYYMADGTVKDAWCYANSSGVLQYGWQKIGSDWYYFVPSSGYMVTGRIRINGTYYNFDSSGKWLNN